MRLSARRWRRRRLRELPEAVAALARNIANRAAFQAEAREVAIRFGRRSVRVLRKRFHQAMPAPAEFQYPKRPFGAWLAAWQFAIFEVFYNLREVALPVVREVAFGGYDWTQGNAIEVLCRWAAEGLDRERTLRDLRYEMPNMRPEALECALGPLLFQARDNTPLQELIKELRSVPQFDQVCRDADRSAAG